MSVTVYSKPNCNQCDATVRILTKKEIPFNYIDFTNDIDAEDKVRNSGALQAPYVEVIKDDGTSESWSGFRIDRINALAS